MCWCSIQKTSAHSVTLNIRSSINIANINKSTVVLEESKYIPHISNKTVDVLPVKLNSSIKSDLNISKLVETSHPTVKEVSVIETNITEITTIANDDRGIGINHSEIFTYSGSVVEKNQSATTLGCSDSETQDGEDGDSGISIAGIAGITLGCISIIAVISVVSFIVYRNYGFNRPQVLNDHFSNPDSSGYIDDSTVRENSEEMYSLDNDSFLNSLEAMTIQNLWTDTVKHTKL